VEAAIQRAASMTGMDPNVLRAVAYKESSYNPTATNPSGAQGLFQFMPKTAQSLGVNPFDINSAAAGAATYLRNLRNQFGGNMQQALAAYNWGPGNLAKYGMNALPSETQDYVQKISNWAGLGQ
jgi:soluble lytic murein transglycosylase-like protein